MLAITDHFKKASEHFDEELKQNLVYRPPSYQQHIHGDTECFVNCFMKCMLLSDMPVVPSNKSFWSSPLPKWHVCLKCNIMCKKCRAVKSPQWMDLSSQIVWSETHQNTVAHTAAFSSKGKDVFLNKYTGCDHSLLASISLVNSIYASF